MLGNDISNQLRQRGHEVTAQGKLTDTMLPDTNSANLTAFINILYTLMDNESFRKNIRNWAYESKIETKYQKLIDSYISLANNFDKSFLSKISSSPLKIARYSKTFEWYISELLTREFGAKSTGFGIRLKDANTDDEFDCIGVFDEGVVFVECKTGKDDVYKEVNKFNRRDIELAATYSMFIFDRDYAFAKGVDEPQLKKSQAQRLRIDKIEKISKAKVVFYLLSSGKRYFLILPGFNNLTERIRHIIRFVNMVNDGGYSHQSAYNIEPVEFKEK